MGQRVMSQQICQVKTLGSFRAQKFSPRWYVEEQIANGDRRAARMARIFHITHATTFDKNTSAGRLDFGLADQLNARDRGDGGERFTSEPECSDGSQIFRSTDF